MKTFFVNNPARFSLTSIQNMVKITEREREIIHLLSEGLASKQIADKLNLSKHTVDTHRRNLLKKTDSKNSLELVMNYNETTQI
jgi:DNA-binding CsgD family transcriptional regulator